MTKDIFSKLPDFKNEDELKNFLRVEKNIDYYNLFRTFSPNNSNPQYTYKDALFFECLLQEVPDLWIKINHFGENIYLAQQVAGIVNHFAKDNYWNIFVKKLGESLKFHDKSQHKVLWEEALLKCSPLIFHKFNLFDEIKKSIGEKELENIFLKNMNDINVEVTYRFEIESALNHCSDIEIEKLIKEKLENQEFRAVNIIRKYLSIDNDKIINIELENKNVSEYLKEKQEEYIKKITKHEVNKNSHEEIEKIFRKNLLDENHDYRLNYFELNKLIDALNIESISNAVSKNKTKMKV